jgi:hypothetical protein
MKTITVQFNQPMKHGGGTGRVDNTAEYDLYRRYQTNAKVPITAAVYDPDTRTVRLTMNTGHANWEGGFWYTLEVRASVRNTCETPQSAAVQSHFLTAVVP